MKLLFLLVFCAQIAGSTGFALAGERRIVENHGVGVFTTERAEVVMVLRNEDCLGHYRVASGKTVVGEGRIDFRILPVTDIPFGDMNLRISCIADRLQVIMR